MSFPQFPPLAALAVIAAVVVLIVALHMLRPRSARSSVASLVLWARVLHGMRRTNARWRWWLTLLLALAIGSMLALSLVWPQSSAGDGARLLVVIDNAPSMQARTHDGATRWKHALAAARAFIRAQGAATQIRVADTMGLAAAGGFDVPARALDTLDAIVPAGFGTPRLPAMLVDSPVPVHLFTDGVGMPAAQHGVTVHSVFEAADNVALTAFDVRASPAQPSRIEALVQIYNASPGAVQTRVALRAQNGFHAEQRMELASGEMADLTFDVGDAQGVLVAGVSTPGDAFGLDDLGYALMPHHGPREIVLVTPGDSALEDSLRALPGVRLTVVPPARFDPAARFDACVFDRFAPPRPPSGGSLVLGSQRVTWLPPTVQHLQAPLVGPWDTGHPVTAHAQWSALRLQRAGLIATAPTTHALLRSPRGEGALLVALEQPQRIVYAGFAASESNLALQPWFAVFLGHALDWVAAPVAVVTAQPGIVAVALADAHVTDGNGARVRSESDAEGTRFVAAQPDVYEVRKGTDIRRVVVNRFDPRFSAINDVAPAAPAAPPPPAAASWPTSSTTALLAAVFALLLLDWLAWLRRITI